MADKKMRAYQVQGYEYGVIVYATSNVSARRQGAGELNEEFEDIDSCTLAPWADEYYGKDIPFEVSLANGWWFECTSCSNFIHEETEDKKIQGNRIFCSSNCADRFSKQWSE